MRKLTLTEIEEFASRKGVRRTPVENFLGTMYDSDTKEATLNLFSDAKIYGWNEATVKAIAGGILLASKGEQHVTKTK